MPRKQIKPQLPLHQPTDKSAVSSFDPRLLESAIEKVEQKLPLSETEEFELLSSGIARSEHEIELLNQEVITLTEERNRLARLLNFFPSPAEGSTRFNNDNSFSKKNK